MTGVVILEESFTLMQGIGTLLIIFGIYNANVTGNTEDREEISAEETSSSGGK